MTKCPCCESEKFERSDDWYIICKSCGLVVAAANGYTAGIKLTLDFGIIF